MASELEGPRTAIVTGGAKRIGAEICARAGGRRLACPHPLQPFDRRGARRWPRRSATASVVQADLADAGRGRRRSWPRSTGCRRRACSSTTPRASSTTTADGLHRRRLGRASRRQSARAGLAVAGVRGARRRGRGLIVNLLDAKLAAPNPGFLQLHHLQDRPRRPHRALRPRLRARRSGSAGSRRR